MDGHLSGLNFEIRTRDCRAGRFTPLGQLQIAEKIGDNAPAEPYSKIGAALAKSS